MRIVAALFAALLATSALAQDKAKPKPEAAKAEAPRDLVLNGDANWLAIAHAGLECPPLHRIDRLLIEAVIRIERLHDGHITD